MKLSNLITAGTALIMALSLSAVGCHKKPVRPTAIPGNEQDKPGLVNPPPAGDRGPTFSSVPTTPSNILPPPTPTDLPPVKPGVNGGIALNTNDWTLRAQDRDRLKAFTVYFDFDRSVIRSDQAEKVKAVADQFKTGAPAEDLLIEGHCDERGTEEYNRALGERRALALRELLTSLGVNPMKIYTVTYGKDKPAVEGHNEEAWSKNRRGEFIILLPGLK